MRVLYLTNYAAPYKVQFFDRMGKYVDLTVLFAGAEEQQVRSAAWFVEGDGGFEKVFLNKKAGSLAGEHLCLDVIHWLRKGYDKIIIGGYSSPTAMLAMAWLRLHRIPFYMSVDGGLIREESAAKYRFKKLLVTAASEWLSSGKYTTDFLVHYGAKQEHIHEYPFSSLLEQDIADKPVKEAEKEKLRAELGIEEPKMVLSVGQFIHRKAFDILIRAAASLDADTGIYIVGGEPTEEYLQMVRDLNLKNVHFVGFAKKERLALYYKAADLFALPTREDIWGLVIGEAMAYGLPVITTDRCVAGLELVENGVSGCIIPVEDVPALSESIAAVFAGGCRKMGEAALNRIRPYTIENMVEAHIRILNGGR